MWIQQVHLTNFRNYPRLGLELAPGRNYLFGPNGAGKTNLLEAIRVGAHGRSHRGAQDAELARWGTAAFRVRLKAAGSRRSVELEVTWEQGTGKRATLDRAPLPRLADVLGQVPVVIFSPQDLDLVQSGPVFRRRYLDLLLCQVRPAYYDQWLEYQRVLAQRNKLLRATGGTPPPKEQEVWDSQLVATGGPLIEDRRRLVASLNEVVPGLQAAVAGGREDLQVEYRPGVLLPPAGDPAEAFHRHLVRARPLERRRGTTMAGPHRDELVLRLDGRDARATASQGQQRTVALALKLAEVELLRRQGEEPVLLLDDVFSELDPGRRGALLRLLERPGQTLVTAAAPDGVPPARGDDRAYQVGGGHINRCQG
ncbi:MAG: DNA replication/repair protein RecF [bacterium]|nr:DNA replication/repair protein RecF [bacterium]